MAHDPRAPRIAALATLLSAGILILTAINLNLTLVGSGGLSEEEYVALTVVGLMLLVRFWAGRELEVPEFTQRSIEANQDFTPVSFRSLHQQTVNPTTQSIITGILGETAQSAPDVNSAMATLGVANTPAQAAVASPAAPTHLPSQGALNYRTEVREAVPADPNDGRTMQRSVNQPVPLPGQRAQDLVDPTTIPGLETQREFVTDGKGLVPLPSSVNSKETAPQPSPKVGLTEQAAPEPASSLPPLELPSISDLFDEPNEEASAESPVQPVAELDLPTLPDLPSPEENRPSSAESDIPLLPNLDDLF